MSLDRLEREAIEKRIADLRCKRCGGKLVAFDDGYSSAAASGWGIPGAYVYCDDCGELFDPPSEPPNDRHPAAAA